MQRIYEEPAMSERKVQTRDVSANTEPHKENPSEVKQLRDLLAQREQEIEQLHQELQSS